MDGQALIVAMLIGLACCHLAWRGWRLFRAPGPTCGSNCHGCPGPIQSDMPFVRLHVPASPPRASTLPGHPGPNP
jgi:hypothetical protein